MSPSVCMFTEPDRTLIFSESSFNSPCRHTDSERQVRKSASALWCCHAWTGRRGPSDRRAPSAGHAPALETPPQSWWPFPPETSEQTEMGLCGRLEGSSSCSRPHLHCWEPPRGDAHALSTQPLRTGRRERRAVAAAAVYRLCLPAPAEHGRVVEFQPTQKMVSMTTTLTSHKWPLPRVHPSCLASADQRPAPAGGWCCFVTSGRRRCPETSEHSRLTTNIWKNWACWVQSLFWSDLRAERCSKS